MKNIKIRVLAMIILLGICISSILSINAADKIETENTKLSSSLQNIVSVLEDNETTSVLIKLNSLDVTVATVTALDELGYTMEDYLNWRVNKESFDLSEDEVDKFIDIKRKTIKQIYSKYNITIGKKLLSDAETEFISSYTPYIVASLSSKRIFEVSKSNDVECLDYYTDESVTDITNMNNVSDVDIARNNYGFDGTGVKIGFIDHGNINASYFSTTDLTVSDNAADKTVGGHCGTVLQIMTSIAPNAKYYYTTHWSEADNYNGSFVNEIEWLIDQGVHIINASISINDITLGMDGNDTYGAGAEWLDELVYNTNVIFVKSSGNLGAGTITTGGMAYNIISVGNYDYNGTVSNYNDDTIESGSLPSSYSTKSDRHYKPDITAPGQIGPSSGTSWAAPQVAGITGLMIDQDYSLRLFPEDVKAIITAGVNLDTPHHYVPGDWSTTGNSYMKFGAGLVNAYNCMSIIDDSHTSGNSISSTPRTIDLEITSSMVGKTFRVSLSYLKSSLPLANLDLKVYNPNNLLIASSTTLYNNIEIVEFTPTAAGTYTIVVEKIAGTDNPYYCLAYYYQ